METGMRLPLTTRAVGRAWQRPGRWTRTVSGVPAQPLPDAPTSLFQSCLQPQEQTPQGASHFLLRDVGHLIHGGTRTSRCSGGKLKRWGQAWRVLSTTPAQVFASQGRFALRNLLWAPLPFPAWRQAVSDAGGAVQPHSLSPLAAWPSPE